MEQAIVLVSYGTLDQENREIFRMFCQQVKSLYPTWTVVEAYTSSRIVNRMGKNQVNYLLPHRLEQLLHQGIKHVVIQPLHLIEGVEYVHMVNQVKAHQRFDTLVISKPLIYDRSSCERIADIIIDSMTLDTHQGALWVGHGSPHPANAYYHQLQAYFSQQKVPIYVGLLQGEPSIETVSQHFISKEIKQVKLCPLLIGKGRHMKEDLFGDQRGSWLRLLTTKGFEVIPVAESMIENRRFQGVFLDHLHQRIS